VKWTVVVEYDPETRHYVATVPGLDIVADAKSAKTVVRLAREAIPLHLEALRERGKRPVVRAKVLQVDV
jgi:predicted RNase H-like HicB family nuclease